MPDCIIRAGESVDPTDPRLSDTACIIETGVIIRPPPDLTLAVEPVVKKAVVPKPPKPTVVAPLPMIEIPIEPPVTDTVVATGTAAAVAHTAVPDAQIDAPPMEEPGVINPTTVMVAAGAAVAVAGTAAAGSAMGGLSAIQAKIASVFGTSKGAIATATVITAGTIVAVKALESKMNNLEKDLEKTKKEVGDTASSIDRIDALLDKLGS